MQFEATVIIGGEFHHCQIEGVCKGNSCEMYEEEIYFMRLVTMIYFQHYYYFTPMDLQELKKFILEAGHNTYASEDPNIKVKENDGSTTITYEKGHWFYHDNYFGGEPYGGREVVFFEGKPVWMMVYYGWVVAGVDPSNVYKLLAKALRGSTLEMPYRGPKEMKEETLIYTNSLSGDVDRFSGEESIIENDKVLYQAKYMGGLVDKN